MVAGGRGACRVTTSYSKRNVLLGAAWLGGRGAARLARVTVAPAPIAARAPGAARSLSLLEEIGRREQQRARDTAERALDEGLHRALESRWAGELVERLLMSPQADAAMRRLLDGPVGRPAGGGHDRRRAWSNGRRPS